MSIISVEESHTLSALYQKDGRTLWIRTLTTGEHTFWFQTARVNSASSGATGSCWGLCTPVWDETYCFLIVGPHLVVQSFLPALGHTVLTFSSCPGSGLLCKLWGYPCSPAWPRGSSSPVQFSFQCVNCPASIYNNCQSRRWQTGQMNSYYRDKFHDLLINPFLSQLPV